MLWERDADTVQKVVDEAPPAGRYFSDGFNVYPTLLYAPGRHAVAPGESETFSVEGDNAELRHSLARAVTRAVALFVYAWNRRQRFKRQFPKLPAHVCDFAADLIAFKWNRS